MIKIIEYTMLDYEDLPEGRYIDLEEMLKVAKRITIRTIFKAFLEEPNEYIVTSMSFNESTGFDKVVYDTYLKEAYYQKHIGKFTKEAQEQIMTDLVNMLIDELNKVNWKIVGWDGDSV